jgi:hypothetical protein
MSASEQESQGPVIRDRRRIDPVTGQRRRVPGGSSSGPAGQQAQSAEQDQSNEQERSAEETRAGDGSAGQTPRGSGQSRPGKHAASKPGSLKTEAAGGTAIYAQAQQESGAQGAGSPTDQPVDDEVVDAEIVEDERPGSGGDTA